MKRKLFALNTDWLYCPEDDGSFGRKACSEKRFRPVSLPHTNVELPYHNFDNIEYQFVSWYRKHVALPSSLKGRRILLNFAGVMTASDVFVNGRKAASHNGGYVPFTVDLTDLVAFGPRKENVIAVRVDSRERRDIPPFGGEVDYLTFGGIYREVSLVAASPFFVQDVFAKPRDVLKKAKGLELSVALANMSGQPRSGTVEVELLNQAGKCVCRAFFPEVEVEGRGTFELRLDGLRDVALWDVDGPNLYTARVTLKEGGAELDSLCVRFGFREAVFTADGPFLLNGRQLKLRGLDRHQTFPYVGGAAPARLQRRDAEILRHELGCNIVRTSHYPQSPHFLDRCDEIGLLVFEETPGWAHIGDERWKQVTYNDVTQMILRDRNHPCIVLWGVRINESGDDHDFYTETNRIAHDLDPTRQTGGVRCFEGSELLEDVYTMNDFAHSGGKEVIRDPQKVTRLARNVPYLVTEFNGHMYSTKSFDQEERLVEHALRHARVQNAIAGHPNIAGGIGWCAFDYNTHYEFGSGDRVCYHGASDIFRFPKFAAWFYESQMDPEVRPVLRVASRWKLGERSGGGVEPLVVFSNCDEIEIHVGGEKRGRFKPDRERFPHLPHPPFFCTGLGNVWGRRWQDLRAVGFLGGKAAAEQRMAADGVPHQLICRADDAELIADGADMTRIAVCVADRYGNALPYATTLVTLTAAGPGTLVGENPFSLVGGVRAVYLRAGRRAGTVSITAAVARLEPQTIKVRMRPCRGVRVR